MPPPYTQQYSSSACTVDLTPRQAANIPQYLHCRIQSHPPNSAPTTTQSNMAQVNWRTINIDLLDPDSSANFDLSSLTPAVQPVSTSDVQTLAGQIKQLSRGGDAEGALRGALENPPYGADAQGKVRHPHPIYPASLETGRHSSQLPRCRRRQPQELTTIRAGNPRTNPDRSALLNPPSRHPSSPRTPLPIPRRP